MRTGAAAGHTGYFHEALLYASAQELLAVVVPFLLDGVAAGEPTVVSLGEQHTELVRAALAPEVVAAVVFHPGGDVYARPASAIRAYREMLADLTASGATQIRLLGELPPSELGATWDWWAHAPNGGFGLWLAHQLCDHVTMTHTDEGFTLRLISGDPYQRVDPRCRTPSAHPA